MSAWIPAILMSLWTPISKPRRLNPSPNQAVALNLKSASTMYSTSVCSIYQCQWTTLQSPSSSQTQPVEIQLTVRRSGRIGREPLPVSIYLTFATYPSPSQTLALAVEIQQIVRQQARIRRELLSVSAYLTFATCLSLSQTLTLAVKIQQTVRQRRHIGWGPLPVSTYLTFVTYLSQTSLMTLSLITWRKLVR